MKEKTAITWLKGCEENFVRVAQADVNSWSCKEEAEIEPTMWSGLLNCSKDVSGAANRDTSLLVEAGTQRDVHLVEQHLTTVQVHH